MQYRTLDTFMTRSHGQMLVDVILVASIILFHFKISTVVLNLLTFQEGYFGY